MEFLFGEYRLDIERHELSRDGTPVSLEPQVFDVLVYLVRNRKRVVSKDELLTSVWGGRIVSDAAIDSRLMAVRRAVGDNGRTQALIRTFARKGVRFVGEVTEENTAPLPQTSRPALALPDKPSLVVLPFTNMGTDDEQEFFADGITEDIITALSRYPWIFVSSRSSSFAFKDRLVEVRQIGHELGVRYVLEGGVRRADDQIRVTAKLVETETGYHLWAEQYNRRLVDIFSMQDEIAKTVSLAIAPAIDDAEMRRAMRTPTRDFDAWTAYQRRMWHLRKYTPVDNAIAHKFFEQAIDLDPSFPGGYKGLVWTQIQAAAILQTLGLAEARNSAEACARRAVVLDPTDAEAHIALALTLWFRGDHEGALAEAKSAVAISPNLAGAHAMLGQALVFSGHPRAALTTLATAIALDPSDPMLSSRFAYMAMGHYFCCEYEAALNAAKQAVRSNPGYPTTYRWLAAILGQLGRIEEATEALRQATATALASFDMHVRSRMPWMLPEDHAHMVEGLRKAGWNG